MLLIQVYPAQIHISELYSPKTLPRDQWYEVASIDDGDYKNCINQFLAANYRESYWGITRIKKSDECRDSFEKINKIVAKSEFFSIKKTQVGLEFILQGKDRIHKKVKLWNFQKNKFIKLGKFVKEEAKMLESGDYCERYNNNCEPLIAVNCERCSNGWINVVGDGCLVNHSKMCLKSCGAKGEVACSQGNVSEGKVLNLVCPEQRHGAICEKGLTVYCFEHTVYCK